MTDNRWNAYPASNPCPHRKIVPRYVPIDGAPTRPSLADVSLAMIECGDCGDVLYGEAVAATVHKTTPRGQQPVTCDHDEWVELRELCQREARRLCTSCGQDLSDE